MFGLVCVCQCVCEYVCLCFPFICMYRVCVYMFSTGLYCSGWVKRGPVGVIVSTMNDAFETAEVIATDIRSGMWLM